jgi:DNA uptake protein ComE-like DNA-binding protein
MTRTSHTATVTVALIIAVAVSAQAQVGKSLGIVDANTASEADLAAFPSMTPALATALVTARPFDNILALNAFLLGQKLSQEQANAFYQKAFVHINLNTAPAEEIMLVPGAGRRMAREFAEYRPWKSWAQFDKEIGKYVDAKEVRRLWRYVVIQ